MNETLNIKGVSFSKREMEVMSCIINRIPSKEIGNILGISHNTVDNHIRNVCMKAKCSSRNGVIDFIHKSGKKSLLSNVCISGLEQSGGVILKITEKYSRGDYVLISSVVVFTVVLWMLIFI